jgi:hypothetical protein
MPLCATRMPARRGPHNISTNFKRKNYATRCFSSLGFAFGDEEKRPAMKSFPGKVTAQSDDYILISPAISLPMIDFIS